VTGERAGVRGTEEVLRTVIANRVLTPPRPACGERVGVRGPG
jgi:hypothetical protein